MARYECCQPAAYYFCGPQDPRAAIGAFTQANNRVDTWIGHFDQGRAYLDLGAFAEADSEFDRCITRRVKPYRCFSIHGPRMATFRPSTIT
jgi:hypothetical protein